MSEHKKTSEQIVDGIIHSYYHEHHNLNRFRSELARAVGTRDHGFEDAKQILIADVKEWIDNLNRALMEPQFSIYEDNDTPYHQELRTRVSALLDVLDHVTSLTRKN